jgi:uncharacterized NAD(P)/FAD-binding protein YdhS
LAKSHAGLGFEVRKENEMRSTNPARLTVAIVGGGFTGAAIALHLAEKAGKNAAFDIVVFEPRARLGAGLAYDTREDVHRINVPAGRMSLYPETPEHFQAWIDKTDALKGDRQAFAADGLPYPRREVFGHYVEAHLAPWVTSGAVRHHRAKVSDISPLGGQWRIAAEDGSSLPADIVVLAATHPAPSLPRVLADLRDDPRLIADATRPGTLDSVEKDDRVLIVGNGLTAADVIAALGNRGHTGDIVSISRRGLRSRGHAPQPQEGFGDFVSEPSPTASHLLHRVRIALRAASAQGLTWHSVLDAVRGQGQAIWQSLPVAERRRIARHVRPFWDVHRFRIAPQVEAAVDDAISAGRLTVLAASVNAAEVDAQGLAVTLKPRRSKEKNRQHFDRVIVTTGPDHGGVFSSQPFLASLAGKGIVAACPTGLGILCDRQGHAIDAEGEVVDGVYIGGPLARGTFGELMGLPQVSEYAVFIADRVLGEIEAANVPAAFLDSLSRASS